jgi:hypothetical protein
MPRIQLDRVTWADPEHVSAVHVRQFYFASDKVDTCGGAVAEIALVFREGTVWHLHPPTWEDARRVMLLLGCDWNPT